MSSDDTRFPTEWPANCPPADAVEGPLTVFRAVKDFPNDHDEFKSASETGKHKNACPCQRLGISVQETLRDALHHREAYPYRGNIIVGVIGREHGNAKATPTKKQSGHWTWWPSEGLDRTSIFTLHAE